MNTHFCERWHNCFFHLSLALRTERGTLLSAVCIRAIAMTVLCLPCVSLLSCVVTLYKASTAHPASKYIFVFLYFLASYMKDEMLAQSFPEVARRLSGMVPALAIFSCGTLGKLLSHSVPWSFLL